MPAKNKIVLSLYPNTRGLGYVCLETPDILIDYGVVTVKPVSNDKLFERIQKFISFFKPEIIILRDYESNERVKDLLHKIISEAHSQRLLVHKYSRNQVKDIFEQFGAKTKIEIAKVVIERLPELEHKAPKIRNPWEPEDYSMGIFDAVALVMTHQYLTG